MEPGTFGRSGMTAGTGAQDSADRASLWSYAALLLRRRRLIVGTGLAASLIAGVVSLLTPRDHKAKASFVSQEPPGPQGAIGQLATQFVLPLRVTNAASPQFYADLLVSRTVMRDVLLTEYEVAQPRPFRGTLVEYFRIHEDDPVKRLARGLRRLHKIVEVTVSTKTGVVEFAVTTESPALSLRVAQRMLELVNDYNLRRRQSQARQEREFLEGRLTEVRRELSQAEDSLARFSRRNRRLADSPELQVEQERLQRQVTLRQQVYLTLAQNFEAAKLEEVRSTPLISVIDQPDVFVEPLLRHTLLKVLAAFLVATVLVAGFTLATAVLRRAGEGELGGYREFMEVLRDATADVRRLFGRAA